MPKKKMAASALTDHIGYWLRLVSNSVSHSFARKLEATGVTVAEWVILREMYDREGSTSPSEVASYTGLSRGAVSKLIERLKEKKLVARSESAEDRRYQDIKLTNSGKAIVPKLAAIADQNDEAFFSALSQTEQRQLTKLLMTLARQHDINKKPIA